MAVRGKLNLCAAQCTGSISTAAAMSKPACSNPRLSPPAPEKRSIPIGRFCFIGSSFAADSLKHTTDRAHLFDLEDIGRCCAPRTRSFGVLGAPNARPTKQSRSFFVLTFFPAQATRGLKLIPANRSIGFATSIASKPKFIRPLCSTSGQPPPPAPTICQK